MPEGLAFVLVAVLALIGLGALARGWSPRPTVVRDGEGNVIDPATLESDEPAEMALDAEVQERDRRWASLTRSLRAFSASSWWSRR